MSDNKDLIEENKRLKNEVETYQIGYENLLTEKLMLEQEYENFKLAMEESKKMKNPGIYGSTTVMDFQFENIKHKTEIDEHLKTIWEMQTTISLKEEAIRELEEKNKKLEEELKLLKEEKKENNRDENKEKDNLNELEDDNIKGSIMNMNDLYKTTILSNSKNKIKKRLKDSTNFNFISEDEMKKKEKEEEERKKKEKEEFERKIKEEEQKKKIEEEKNKKELEKKIKEYDIETKELEKKFDEIKIKNKEYYNDVLNQDIYIENYKSFINELNEEINKLKDQLNISVYEYEDILENEKRNEEYNPTRLSLERINLQNIQLNRIIEECKNETLKGVEKIHTEIQEKINEINKEKNNESLITLKNIYEKNNEIISNKLKELESLLEVLESKKKQYEETKKVIEDDIDKLKKQLNKKIEKIKKSTTILMGQSQINNENKNSKNNSQSIDSIFLRGSMLLGINDFGKINDIFSSKNIFIEDKNEKYEKQDLLRKNWNEVCFVYQYYDIHDITYELEAVGLPPNCFFSTCSMGFVLDTNIEILIFEKDGKKSEYKYKQNQLEFNIKLKNEQKAKIHVKYKESPLKSKISEGEKKEGKFVKYNYYGLSKNNAGQNGKFTLKIKCDFEVISFKDEFFIKTNEKEYTWGGRVPPEGKKTLVKLSKLKAKFNFFLNNIIKSKNHIKNSKMIIPVNFVGGNNEIIQLEVNSKQTDNIILDEKNRQYNIQFSKTNSNLCELIIQGVLINKCKGEWICDLTKKQIEENIPQDYKDNKNRFKEKAQEIIEDYDKIHNDDMIKVPDVVKVGKWVNNNIKYDISYCGREDITATDVLNIKVGVCHHFTKLFNALMYSLGYEVIYISGYALDKKDTFGENEAHAWSLIKINGKWLPFDATWGIFSGKLPVSHVFKQFFNKGVTVLGTDHVSFDFGKQEGKYLDK